MTYTNQEMKMDMDLNMDLDTDIVMDIYLDMDTDLNITIKEGGYKKSLIIYQRLRIIFEDL